MEKSSNAVLSRPPVLIKGAGGHKNGSEIEITMASRWVIRTASRDLDLQRNLYEYGLRQVNLVRRIFGLKAREAVSTGKEKPPVVGQGVFFPES
jgi:hypothetical protein